MQLHILIAITTLFSFVAASSNITLSLNVKQYPYNPVLLPTAPSWPTAECDNIYSQEIVYWKDNTLLMYYGGWDGTNNDCHDQIWLAYSIDGGVSWRKYMDDDKPYPVLPVGSSLLVNDPSIVIGDGIIYMYYTDNAIYNGVQTDRVWLATSGYITDFQKWGQIFAPPMGSWCQTNAGRPAVIYDEGIFKMWYDCAANGIRSVAYATSTDGYHFTNYAGNPLFQNGGGIDVKKINGTYYMLQEGRSGSTLSWSADGIHWTNEGVVVPLSGKYYDAYGQVVPSFQIAPNGTFEAIWFGGATNAQWDQNCINVAYPANFPSGGGCTGCTTPGISCARQCQLDGISDAGVCGAPGSTNPNQCCSCYNDGCQTCVVGAVDCHLDCVNNGYAGGICAFPGTNPSQCCACL